MLRDSPLGGGVGSVQLVFFRVASILSFILLLTDSAMTQCTVNSSTGYSVNIQITLRELVKPATCPNGYNYNVRVGYTITFTGSNRPSSLYTLQGRVYCGAQNLFFDLPNDGGTGQVTTTSNPWRGTADCNSATLSSLGCRNVIIEINGPGIANQNVSCTATILPITLLDLHAQADGEGVDVAWTTAMEQDNDHFTVERSLDGLAFTPAIHVPSAGNAVTIQQYSVRDPWTFSGTAYYRLRQTDMDGTATVTDAIAVPAPTMARIRIHPNPVDQGIISVNGELHEGSVIIVDATGKEVLRTRVQPQLMIGNLPPGSYILRIMDDDGRSTAVSTFVKL